MVCRLAFVDRSIIKKLIQTVKIQSRAPRRKKTKCIHTSSNYLTLPYLILGHSPRKNKSHAYNLLISYPDIMAQGKLFVIIVVRSGNSSCVILRTRNLRSSRCESKYLDREQVSVASGCLCQRFVCSKWSFRPGLSSSSYLTYYPSIIIQTCHPFYT